MRRELDENWPEKGVRMRNLGWQHLESVEMGLLLIYQWFQIQIHSVKINLLASSCRLGLLNLLKWFHDFVYLTGKNCFFCAPHTWVFQLNTFLCLFPWNNDEKWSNWKFCEKSQHTLFQFFFLNFKSFPANPTFRKLIFILSSARQNNDFAFQIMRPRIGQAHYCFFHAQATRFEFFLEGTDLFHNGDQIKYSLCFSANKPF